MKYVLISLFFLLLLSCETLKVNDSTYMKVKDDASYELVDSKKAITGLSANQIVKLKNSGDSYIVQLNKPFLFSLENFNPNELTIITEIHSNKEMATIKVINKREPEIIEIKESCQTYCSYDLDYFPTFTVAPNLKKEQIIFTPIYNNKSDCKLIGYQIRYGDQQLAGCKEEAGNIYDVFKGCRNKATSIKTDINSEKNEQKQKKKITISFLFFGEN